MSAAFDAGAARLKALAAKAAGAAAEAARPTRKPDAEQPAVRRTEAPRRRVSNGAKALLLLLLLFGFSAALRITDGDMLSRGAEELAQLDPLAAMEAFSDRAEDAAAGDDVFDTAAIETATTPTGADPIATMAADALQQVRAADPAPPSFSGAPLASAPGSATAEVLEALRAREAELSAYADRLASRDAELKAAEQRLRDRLSQLEGARDEFAALLATIDQAARRDVEHLISMYERMKPRKAAALFDEMAPEVAAGFFGRMKADRAAAIMAGMNPQKAYAVSLTLAGRNVRPETNLEDTGAPKAQ